MTTTTDLADEYPSNPNAPGYQCAVYRTTDVRGADRTLGEFCVIDCGPARIVGYAATADDAAALADSLPDDYGRPRRSQ